MADQDTALVGFFAPLYGDGRTEAERCVVADSAVELARDFLINFDSGDVNALRMYKPCDVALLAATVLAQRAECHGRRFDPNLVREVKELRAEVERLRKVVDVATAWRDTWRHRKPFGAEDTAVALVDAVDVFAGIEKQVRRG